MNREISEKENMALLGEKKKKPEFTISS